MAGRIAAQGMNAEELKANPQLSDFVVKDLNADPQLPFEDEAFDAVTCALSVDYLTRPKEVFREVMGNLLTNPRSFAGGTTAHNQAS